ncbi:MAG: hypothetical protein KBH03_06220 [Paludibacteraceae bacterium]|nr:hypothetical protein [Paludibacteraceae bacterium]
MTDTTYISAQTIQDLQSATSTVGLKDWLGLIALFLSALVAVLVGQYLQDTKTKKDRKYQNKLSVFSVLFGNRHSRGFNENFVISMNQIPMVFNDNQNVISHYDKYIKNHTDNSITTNLALKKLDSNLCDLLLSMARDVGYVSLTTETILNPFYPDASYFLHQANSVYNKRYVEDYVHQTEQVHAPVIVQPTP